MTKSDKLFLKISRFILRYLKTFYAKNNTEAFEAYYEHLSTDGQIMLRRMMQKDIEKYEKNKRKRA